jgi:receptor protein-tyrosine kinase
VAVNLAQVLAALGQAVLLVDCDLRRPAILRMLKLEDQGSGLGSLLTERSELGGELLDQIVQPTRRPGLFVLSSGARIANPLPLLASPFMRKLLDYLSGQDRMSLLAAPPALGAADVSVLAPKADGVILVVRQAYSRREQVAAALKQLQASRARVLGAVFVLRSGMDWGHK